MERLVYSTIGLKSDPCEIRIVEMEKKFNKKFNEQLIIIENQRNRLDNQQEQINNQRAIIEELAWQIRDLRDSVRKCSEKISTKYNIEFHESDLRINIPKTIEPQAGK